MNIKFQLKKLFPSKRTVNFIICGTQKGGTTALDAYLREHPEICMANEKEVHYFDTDRHFANGKPDYSQYHISFSPNELHKIIGEATPSYMYLYDVPRRIWEYNPNMKLIVVLRNPIERAYSHWNMERSRNCEDLSFWNAIINERKRCRTVLPLQHRTYSYVDRGFYLDQLRRLWTFFPKENILILKNEYMKKQPEKALEDVCKFLGVSPFRHVKAKNVHSRPYESDMTQKERDYLKNIFEFEIKGLERALNWNCNDWL